MIDLMKNKQKVEQLTRRERFRQWLYPVQSLVIVGMISFVIGVNGAMSLVLVNGGSYTPPGVAGSGGLPVPNFSNPPVSERANPAPSNGISPIFTAEIQHWSPKIVEWAQQYNLDPNMLATVMQIESCGDSQAGSIAGAQGLFQVMPFHFSAGEDARDPDTNARRGISYLKQSLQVAGGHFGMALAGYNGGIGVISGGWARWADETRRYYIWGSGIYKDTVRARRRANRCKTG
jgi:hypothetical protein